METLEIPRRYCGPPDSANGGYTAGLMAAAMGAPGAVEVTLKRPVPLASPMTLESSTAAATLASGGDVIASARGAALDLDPPPPPSLDESRAAASRAAPTFFSTCFVCGAKREPRDGLRLFTGPTADRPGVAGVWTPDDEHVDESGRTSHACVWAALDCPGYFALRRPDVMALLGRMTAVVIEAPAPGVACIVAGWPIAAEGRKFTAGTAVYAANDGRVLAKAKTVWIALRT
ncbi:MAG: hypothetical protein GC206_01990 [Alphaproteobacteria bacterium]|nr:hypothetical protein [Alphaproteobacteria bacterium]